MIEVVVGVLVAGAWGVVRAGSRPAARLDALSARGGSGRDERSGPSGARVRRVVVGPPGPSDAPGVAGSSGPAGRVSEAGAVGAAADDGARVPVPLDALLTQVASLLRAGAPPGRAWAHVGVLADATGVPDARALARRAAPGGPSRGGVLSRVGWLGGRPASAVPDGHDVARQVAGVVAGCRVAVDVGASLAPVLDGVAGAVVRTRAADAERRAALAGPQATATLLGWLPVVGAAVAALLGADPVTAVLRGGAPAAAVLAGIALMLAGRRWTRALVRRARDGR